MPSRIDIGSLPAKYQAQAAAQLGKPGAKPLQATRSSQPLATEGAIMLRQSGAGMNKTEALFLAHLQATFPGAWIEREPVALKLGNGVRYNPDFLVHEPADNTAGESWPAQLTAYEVKGHMRDDAAVKIKVAASRFPFIRFVLVWRSSRAGGWAMQTIVP